jgi:ATP-dependent RNA helicase DDX24/MAK5
VFVNSIDAARRLIPVLRNLKIQVFGLHAQMQQRQRLKNIDRFKTTDNSILVASDVAARGLDIPLVEHVVHYQVPRSGDIYVHRSGRTARAGREGVSVLLVSPQELTAYKKLCQVLNKSSAIQAFPVDHSILVHMKNRVQLAREIDQDEHTINKNSHEDDWFTKNAKEMDIDLDDQFLSKTNDEKDAKTRGKIARKRQELNALLSEPLLPRGQSAKYLTSNVLADLAERLLANPDSALPTVDGAKAIHQLKRK